VRKKSKNQENRENKKKLKKPNHEKKSIKILKKPIGLVRFYKSKTEKTELNPNKKNEPYWKKTEPNRFESVFVLKTEPKPVGLNRFQFFFLNLI
jgi:hypothetical protein